MQRITKDQEIEMDLLKNIIQEQFRVDINNRCRKRSIVDSRMVFSKILYDIGYRHSTIALYINKDRTTIIHYIDTCDDILLHDELLMNRYSNVKNIFYESRVVPEKKEEDICHEKTLELRVKIDNLMRKIHAMSREKEKLNRIMPIINLIQERVKHGQEEFARKKINQFLNDLWET